MFIRQRCPHHGCNWGIWIGDWAGTKDHGDTTSAAFLSPFLAHYRLTATMIVTVRGPRKRLKRSCWASCTDNPLHTAVQITTIKEKPLCPLNVITEGHRIVILKHTKLTMEAKWKKPPYIDLSMLGGLKTLHCTTGYSTCIHHNFTRISRYSHSQLAT